MSSKKDQSFPTWSFDKPCTSMEWSELVSASLSIGETSTADLVIVGVFNSDKEVTLSAKAKALDSELSGAITDLIAEQGKQFKKGATLPTLRIVGAAKRVVVIGLGTQGKEEETSFSIGKAIADACHAETKAETCHVILPSAVSSLQDLSTGFYQTLQADNRYRTGDKVKKAAENLKSVTLDAKEGSQQDIEKGRLLAQGVLMSKDIVNAPHNVLNSLSLADTAKRIAATSNGSITCKILGKDECEALGMGAFLGVARGSETPPQLIHLTYKAEGDNLKKVGIVGKGLLFDTGGYNIKVAMMELMKFDCGGAAAVLGAARAVAAIKPSGVEAHFIVAACENMINEKAYVPSDILTAMNGKTIEVLNTDAEGRLTLADALVYADKEVGCEKIIELSTLTGACIVSLGKEIAGVWTSDDELATELADVSKATGEKAWRMPMAKEYAEQLESKIADLKNLGGRWGGSILAAVFLQNFVDEKKPFAHIDVAGPVWSDKEGCATGYGAKMVFDWIRRQGQ